jgi:hypothetical protein
MAEKDDNCSQEANQVQVRRKIQRHCFVLEKRAGYAGSKLTFCFDRQSNLWTRVLTNSLPVDR